MTTKGSPSSTSVKKLNKRAQRVRPTKHLCEERFACSGSEVAEHKCVQCSTFQCKLCEKALHEFAAEFVFHDREWLEPVPLTLVCEWDCADRNLADIRCNNCGKNLCNLCDLIIHSQGKKKIHDRVPFEEPTLDSTEVEQPTLDSLDQYMSLQQNGGSFISAEQFISTDGGPESLHSFQTIPDESFEEHSMKADLEMRDGLNIRSFVLVDNDEVLQVANEKEFVDKLGVNENENVKVVSIFGNTGEGKSHTLNHTFFGGAPVFLTSMAPVSATIGVWAAYDPKLNIIILDTEGLLGVTSNQNKRTRLLLKVLAISDVVICRTRAGRLHTDLYTFLGDASQAYIGHFVQELKAASERCNLGATLSALGPAVIIFHETDDTEIEKIVDGKTPEEQLKQRIHDLSYSIDAFSALEYVGIRTVIRPTCFKAIQAAVTRHLGNSSVRSPRKPAVTYLALKVLNEKFSGVIEKAVPSLFPDEYFTCSMRCLSCDVRCTNTMNHLKDGLPHVCQSHCKYQHQFDNRIFTCKKCYEQGKESIVVPKTSSSGDSAWIGFAKYAWAGYVLECPNCGIIFRSRAHWYGNPDPVDTVVRTEIEHIWPGGSLVLQGTHNAAQKVIDGMSYLSATVTSVGAKPTKILSSWVADKVAPTYWKPNSEIINCGGCKKLFSVMDTKHHCRACGDGFCEDCSTKRKAVPHRGWGEAAVRVCDSCYDIVRDPNYDASCFTSAGEPNDVAEDVQEVTVRKVTEVIQSGLGTVASAIEYPIEWVKHSARPAYWIPDHEIKQCIVCEAEFGPKLAKHHCRACGQGVCDDCSPTYRPVPLRGWDTPVRVCNICAPKVDI